MKPSIRKRIFSRRESTAASSAEMAVFTILNTVLNFLRSVIIASRYGAGTTSDAYYSTVGLLNTPAGLLSDSLTALVSPRSQAYKNKGKEKEYLASYLSVTAIAFIVLAAVFALFGGAIASIVLGGLDAATIGTVRYLLLLSLPIIILSPLSVVLDNFLKSDKFFIFGNSASLINSILSTGVLFFVVRSGVAGIVVSSLLGVIANFVVLIVIAFKKEKLPGKINIGLGLKEAARAFPLFAGGIMGIAAGYVEKYLASFLSTGSITLLSMSSSLIGVARSLLVGTFISVYYPFISETLIKNDRDKYQEHMNEARRIVFGIFGFGCVCMIVLAKPLFTVIFGHGRFSSSDVVSLSAIFGAGSFGVINAALGNLVNFSFYAKEDTKTPVLVSILVGTLGSIVFQYLVVRSLGAVGLSAAVAVAGMANLAISLLYLKKKHGLFFITSYDVLISVMLLLLGVICGFLPWNPWLLVIPPLYYIAITAGLYRLNHAVIIKILRRIFSKEQ
ncbi:MAG: lipid II flippase MurJ [Spirochaetia bacterium]|jgi:putative peptidoglycan lipid II flippase|nr:lipid II flippase MurJ [Spirochaetia bacterium]